jgi:hypothetical protein
MNRLGYPFTKIVYYGPTYQGQLVELTVATESGERIMRVTREVFRDWPQFMEAVRVQTGLDLTKGKTVSLELQNEMAQRWAAITAQELQKIDPQN